MSIKALNPRALQYDRGPAAVLPLRFLLLSFSNPVFIVGIQGKPLLCQPLTLKCRGSPHAIHIFVSLGAHGRQSLWSVPRLFWRGQSSCVLQDKSPLAVTYWWRLLTKFSVVCLRDEFDGEFTSFLFKE